MLGTYFTFPELLLWIPLVTGIIILFLKNESQVKRFALIASVLTLAVSVTSLFFTDIAHHSNYFYYNNVSYLWMPYIGSSFSVGLDGMGFLLTFLTAFSYPLIIASSFRKEFKNAPAFFGLLLLSQAGIIGVFVATDALLFYFFWELALIPLYFLCSLWGAEKRIQATFKFFIYTFTGSLLMLVGIIYVYLHTPQISANSLHSFSISAFYNTVLSYGDQQWLFWLFFVAFAVKIPIWPFHTWQPFVYEQANYPSVMVLSAIMVKMGIFGMLRWLLPIFPDAVFSFNHLVIILSLIGLFYASFIAFIQSDLKRFVAWTSIAHLGLMASAIFVVNSSAMQGVMIEMLNHGINILALWIVVDLIERNTGIKKINELGGLATKSPWLAFFLVIIAFANIALPLTNSFVSEFLMFNGLFVFNKWYAFVAIISIILSAGYMLRMVQLVFFGKESSVVENMKAINSRQYWILGILVVAILFLGIYPQPVINLTKGSAETILKMVNR